MFRQLIAFAGGAQTGVAPSSQRAHVTQEGIVFLMTVALLAIFSLALPNFFTIGNIITLLRSVAVLGMLGLGMGVVVIGRGVDLTMVASLAVGTSWALQMTSKGVPFGPALFAGAGFVAFCGMFIGVVVAFAEIPAVFTTLAASSIIFGVGNALLFTPTRTMLRQTWVGSSFSAMGRSLEFRS